MQNDWRAYPRQHRGWRYDLPRNSHGRPSLSYGCGADGPATPPCPHGQAYGFADGWMNH
jgi:hypothetical protein